MKKKSKRLRVLGFLLVFAMAFGVYGAGVYAEAEVATDETIDIFNMTEGEKTLLCEYEDGMKLYIQALPNLTRSTSIKRYAIVYTTATGSEAPAFDLVFTASYSSGPYYNGGWHDGYLSDFTYTTTIHNSQFSVSTHSKTRHTSTVIVIVLNMARNGVPAYGGFVANFATSYGYVVFSPE